MNAGSRRGYHTPCNPRLHYIVFELRYLADGKVFIVNARRRIMVKRNANPAQRFVLLFHQPLQIPQHICRGFVGAFVETIVGAGLQTAAAVTAEVHDALAVEIVFFQQRNHRATHTMGGIIAAETRVVPFSATHAQSIQTAVGGADETLLVKIAALAPLQRIRPLRENVRRVGIGRAQGAEKSRQRIRQPQHRGNAVARRLAVQRPQGAGIGVDLAPLQIQHIVQSPACQVQQIPHRRLLRAGGTGLYQRPNLRQRETTLYRHARLALDFRHIQRGKGVVVKAAAALVALLLNQTAAQVAEGKAVLVERADRQMPQRAEKRLGFLHRQLVHAELRVVLLYPRPKPPHRHAAVELRARVGRAAGLLFRLFEKVCRRYRQVGAGGGFACLQCGGAALDLEPPQTAFRAGQRGVNRIPNTGAGVGPAVGGQLGGVAVQQAPATGFGVVGNVHGEKGRSCRRSAPPVQWRRARKDSANSAENKLLLLGKNRPAGQTAACLVAENAEKGMSCVEFCRDNEKKACTW